MGMEKNNGKIFRISVVILTIAILISISSSCAKPQETEEITRGTEAIAPPVNNNDNNIFGEEFPDDPTVSTDAQSTTGTETTTGKGTTVNSSSIGTTVPVTVTNSQANQEINQAVTSGNSGGMSVSDIAEFVNVMGYDYDPVQGIFYTSKDNWQRQGNFVAHYDTAAAYLNMNYRTVRVDFGQTDGMDWRIQLWKGLYGPFGGCEIGVYNKDPIENEMLYHCTDDDHLLYMESALYLNKADYEANKIFFTREWQAHWWLTGFKLNIVDPEKLIMTMRIRMRSATMANQFEEGLLNAGFIKGDAKTQYDSYRRSINDFYILWDDLGEMNYIVKQK